MTNNPKRRRAPATSPQARENQVISYAYDLAEKQILDGSASSQVISHFLKLGSSREQLEKERLIRENKLLTAKTEALQSSKGLEALYKNALNAMRSYSSSGGDNNQD